MSLEITGIGTALPRHALTQAEAAELNISFATQDPKQIHRLRALYRRTGVRRRYFALLDGDEGPPASRQAFYPASKDQNDEGPSTAARMVRYEREAPALLEEASRTALTNAGTEPADVTHVVTVSCTGFFAPGLAPALIDRIGLRPAVERTHVGFMGCHGALNGLRVAAGFAGAQADATVLVASVELCSLHFQYGWDAERMVSNALFSDGAAALVGQSAAPDSTGWRIAASGTFRIPDSEKEMTWRIGDHGFHMTLSPSVPDLISDHLEGWLRGWLAESGLALEDIQSWAVHPGGPRVLTAVRTSLGLEPEAVQLSRDILAGHGNMSSATVLFILQELRSRRAPRPCVALAFGPGLVVEATLLL